MSKTGKKKVIQALSRWGGPMTSQDLCEDLDYKVQSVRRYLWELHKEGKVERTGEVPGQLTANPLFLYEVKP